MSYKYGTLFLSKSSCQPAPSNLRNFYLFMTTQSSSPCHVSSHASLPYNFRCIDTFSSYNWPITVSLGFLCLLFCFVLFAFLNLFFHYICYPYAATTIAASSLCHHHHPRLGVRFSVLARVGRFPLVCFYNNLGPKLAPFMPCFIFAYLYFFFLICLFRLSKSNFSLSSFICPVLASHLVAKVNYSDFSNLHSSNRRL